MSGDSFQDLEKRRDRKRRNRRLASGLVALVIAAAGVGGGLYAFRPTRSASPVDTPIPSVVPTTPTLGPTPTSPSPTPPVQELAGQVSGPIQFVDDQRGWMVDADGQILATTDGGHAWNVQISGTSNITAIDMLGDGLHGWGVGDGGLIRTTDGGAHWVTWSNESLSSVQFVTPDIGWGVQGNPGPDAHGAIVKTTDGGATWEPQSVDGDSVCALDERVVFTAGPAPGGVSLSRSGDGGASWIDSLISLSGEPWTATVRCGGIDAWVLVQDGGAAGHLPYALFRTGEGGPDTLPVLQEAGTRPLGDVPGVLGAQDPYPGPFVAFDGQDFRFVGWCPACGNSVALYGGTRERTEVVQQGAMPLGISFADREHGWLLVQMDEPSGSQLKVLVTSDGGSTWTALS